jgi:hypothetical protein
MLEHYSHIRMQAKRVAMNGLSTPVLKPCENSVPMICGDGQPQHAVS